MRHVIQLTLCILIFSYGVALGAAPGSLASSSTFSHGATFTVTGVNFGTKINPAPLRDDDFSGGVVGTVIPDLSTGWFTETGDVYYSTERVRWLGQKSIKQDYDGVYSRYLGLDNTKYPGSIPNTGEMYVSGWFYYNAWDAFSRNVKVLNMGSSDSSDGLRWQTRTDAYPTAGNAHLYAYTNSANCSRGTSSTAQDYFPINDVLKDDSKWHRIESYLKVGTSGHRDLWIDGEKIAEISGPFMADGCGIEYLLIGHYFASDYLVINPPTLRGDDISCSGYVTGAVTKYSVDSKYYTCEANKTWDKGTLIKPAIPRGVRYWDQLYVDTTRARVEVCNANTKAASDHCEIQKTFSWSNTSISFTGYKGSFNTGDKAYLYVYNGNGEVNTAGYPITLGVVVPTNGVCGDESETVNVRPEATCLAGAPTTRVDTESYTAWDCVPLNGGTITDHCVAPFSVSTGGVATFSWQSATSSVNEDGGTQIVGRILRSGSTVGAGSVYWQTDGYPLFGMTASGSEDYFGHGPVQVLFTDGQDYIDVSMAIWPDDLDEGSETTLLTLTAPSGVLGDISQEVLTILDGDFVPPPEYPSGIPVHMKVEGTPIDMSSSGRPIDCRIGDN